MKYSLGPGGPKGLKCACPGRNSRGARGRSRLPGGTPGGYSLKPSGRRTPGPGKIKMTSCKYTGTCMWTVPGTDLKVLTTLGVRS